jgi:hypothetical protein
MSLPVRPSAFIRAGVRHAAARCCRCAGWSPVWGTPRITQRAAHHRRGSGTRWRYRNRTDLASSLQFTVRTLADIEHGVRKASPGTYAIRVHGDDGHDSSSMRVHTRSICQRK